MIDFEDSSVKGPKNARKRPAGMSWPYRVALAVVTVALVWFGLKLALVPENALVLHLGSDRPLSVSLSYATADLGLRSGAKRIAPEAITPGGAQHEVTVTVTPLGRQDPRSRGSEVRLYGVSSKYEAVAATHSVGAKLPEPWALEGDTLRSSGNPVPLMVPLKASGYIDVKLLTSGSGGAVRITADGRSRVVDLYREVSRPASFRIILPVPLDTPQLIETSLPDSTRNLTITFSGGPRLVRLGRAESSGGPSWIWTPSEASQMKLGPGVRLIESDPTGVLIKIAGEAGSVTFPSVRTRSYWWPRWRDAAPTGLVALLVLGVVMGFVLDRREGRSLAEQWSGAVSLSLATVVYLRAIPLFHFGFRAGHLAMTYKGLIASGAPLVAGSEGGTFARAGWGDDLGIHLIAPYIAKWFGIDVLAAAGLLLVGTLGLAVVVGLLGMMRLCRSAAARLYAGIVYGALGWLALATVTDIYTVQLIVPAAFIPWLIVAIPRDREPAWWSEILMLSLGSLGAVVHLVRSNASTAVFIGAVVLVLFARTKAIRKARLVAAMVLGIALVLVAMSGVYASRDAFLARSTHLNGEAKDQHVFWHTIYVGFGYTKNPYVSAWDDRVAFARVASEDPSAVGDIWRSEPIMRNAVWEIVRDDPAFVLRQLGVKIWVVLGFFILILGVKPYYNLGLLGLISTRPDARLLTMFGLMLGFQSLFGLIAIPVPYYVLGFSAVAAILGIVTADAALSDRPLERLRARVGSLRMR